MKRVLFLLWLTVWVPVAEAASFCVTSASELQAAFDTAENNGESDIIRIAEGGYTAPSGGFLFAPNINGGIDENSDIEIIGGWTEFLGTPCGLGPSTDPAKTVLSGGGVNRVMNLRLPQQGEVSIRNLTFIDGFSPDLAQGAGLRIYAAGTLGFSGTLTVQSNAFVANSAGYAAGLMIGLLNNSGNNMQGTTFTNIRVLNNLFVENIARTGTSGALFIRLTTPLPQSGPTFDPRPALTVALNTVINNISQAPEFLGLEPLGDGVTIFSSGVSLGVLGNNLWNNGDTDLKLVTEEAQSVNVRNNNIGNIFQSVPADFYINNLSIEPEYVECGVFCIERTPVGNSPLIDTGISPSPFGSAWSLPDTDAAGDLRVRGSAVDIGAYEGTPEGVFSDRFEEGAP